MKKPKVAVIGGGQMGRALVGGLLVSGVATAESVTVVDPNPDSLAWWNDHHAGVETTDQVGDWINQSQIVLLAVKPHLIPVVASQISEIAKEDKLVVSIAAGVSLESLCEKLGHQRVIRVMPNTPSLVAAGASAYCPADAASEDDCRWLHEALSGVGTAVRVAESQMDAVTGLSGSGPAYVCLVIEALADGGVLAGLPRPLAMQLATQTVMGTAKMVMETGRHPGELKDAVASPGGTTIAALQVLEEKGLRAALIGAVQASANRSKEMG